MSRASQDKPGCCPAGRGTARSRKCGVLAVALLAALLGAPAPKTTATAAPTPPAAAPASAGEGRDIMLHGAAPGRAGCAACHGTDAAGQPDLGIPRLAGLSAAYLEQQLGFFATGSRRNVIMAPYARALDPGQRRAVAHYVASLPVPAEPDRTAPLQAAAARGRVLFAHGAAQQAVIACAQCHGAAALGVPGFSPGLAGQSAPYLADELREWQSGGERDPAGQMMHSVSVHLSDGEIEDVSAYLSGLRRTGPGDEPAAGPGAASGAAAAASGAASEAAPGAGR